MVDVLAGLQSAGRLAVTGVGGPKVEFVQVLVEGVDQARARLANIPQQMHITLRRVMERYERVLIDDARRLASTMLQVRSGRFVASIDGEVVDDASGVVARVFAGDPIAPVLEYGANVPAHDEHAESVKAMMFQVTHGIVFHSEAFAESVHHPADVIKARPVVHDAFHAREDEIMKAIEQAIGNLADQTDVGLTWTAPVLSDLPTMTPQMAAEA